ncbi:hypothetical protein [Streptomyces sp. NPDC055109]
MTRIEAACTAGAVILAVTSVACFRHDMVWQGGLFIFGMVALLEGADRERRHARRLRLEAERAERLARGEQPEPLTPCCLLWLHSGQVHTPTCTRRQFHEITNQFCDQDGGDSPFGWRDDTRDSA